MGTRSNLSVAHCHRGNCCGEERDPAHVTALHCHDEVKLGMHEFAIIDPDGNRIRYGWSALFEEVAIGLWFGARDSTLHAGSGLTWGLMLFDAEATFATHAQHLVAHGRTIIDKSDRLQRALT